jgi:hypothetical protein
MDNSVQEALPKTNTWTAKVVWAVITSLLGAVALGIWQLPSQFHSLETAFGRLETTVNSWTTTFSEFNRRLTAVERMHTTGQHPVAANRLDKLEELHRPGSSHTLRQHIPNTDPGGR